MNESASAIKDSGCTYHHAILVGQDAISYAQNLCCSVLMESFPGDFMAITVRAAKDILAQDPATASSIIVRLRQPDYDALRQRIMESFGCVGCIGYGAIIKTKVPPGDGRRALVKADGIVAKCSKALRDAGVFHPWRAFYRMPPKPRR